MCIENSSKKSKPNTESDMMTLEEFYICWQNNTLLQNVIITESDFTFDFGLLNKMSLRTLSHINITIHNCSNVNSATLEFLLDKCDFSQMHNITISYDDHHDISHAKLPDTDARTITEKISRAIRNTQTFAARESKADFTLSLENCAPLSTHNYDLISYYAKYFDIKINDTNITQERSVA